MREILFRGKAKDGKWYFGDLVQFKSGYVYIQSKEEGESNYVNPETVGQFTGLTDRNGKKIFEGDIVVTRYPKGDICSIGDVQFDSGVFGAEWTAVKENKGMVGSWGQPHNLRRFDDDIIKNIEVIGNIHDNPELLEVE